MRIVKFLLKIFVVVVVIVVASSFYMRYYSLRSQDDSRDIADSYDYISEREYLKNWVDSIRKDGALRDTFIVSSNDGSRLHALYMPAITPTNKTAVIVHGYTDNSVRMLMIGHLYSKELGYNILLPDLHAHGESDGKWIQMGWFDRLDVKQWIDVAIDIFGNDSEIALHGISMGAATVMMTSGDSLPANVKCVVADCGYTSVWDEFKYQLKRDFGLPSFPLMSVTSFIVECCSGWGFTEASALKQIEKSNLPIFFIHGDADKYVPTEMVFELYDAKKNGYKELWIVPGVAHADAYWGATEEYVSRVSQFVSQYVF